MPPRAKKRPVRPRRPYGTGHTYLRGRTWWLAFHSQGQLVRESSGSESRDDAEHFLRKRLSEQDAGRGHAAKLTSLADLERLVLDNYKRNSRRSAHKAAQAWARVFTVWKKAERAKDITPARIERYIARRQETSAAAATINRELAQLRRGFRLAVRLGLLDVRPEFSLLEEAPPRAGFYEAEHVEALLKALPEHVRPVIEVAHETGWRVYSEVLTRQWRHVDMKGGWLRLDPGEGKTGEARVFPFTARLRATLQAQEERKDALQKGLGRRIATVFPGPDGTPVGPDELRRAWGRARIAAGRPGALLHDFRRTAVRALERAGVPRSSAMKMVGHKTESIYRRYAIVDETSLLDAASKLDQLAGAVNNAVNNGRNGRDRGRRAKRT